MLDTRSQFSNLQLPHSDYRFAIAAKGGNELILWTVQDVAVWKQLEETGQYTTPVERIEFPESEDDALNHANFAYRWLADQMSKRVGPPPEGVVYPVWVWYKQQGQHDGKPDMRQSHYFKGMPCMRMKLDVPDWEVLLSDFDDWHHALNYWHCSLTEEDSNEFDAGCESLGVSFHDISNWDLQSPELDSVRTRVEASWERMLGVQPTDEHWHFPWEKRSIQATFWVLKREYVISVERFISR
jgi:hypothetical protein